MVVRPIRMLAVATALAAVLALGSSSAEANWLFPGGGWGLFRPMTWGSYYGGYSTYYGGPGYWGGAYGGACCTPTCGTQCCNYGPACDTNCCNPCRTGGCGVGIAGSGCCGTGCSACSTTSYYAGGNCCFDPCCAGTSQVNCCTPSGSSNDPLPDPGISGSGDNLNRDDFRGNSGGSGQDDSWRSQGGTQPRTPDYLEGGRGINDRPRSSIPQGGSSIPQGGSSIPSGGDAPPFTQPTPPAGDPAPVNEPAIRFNRVEPLRLDVPVASTYRPSRQRVVLTSGSAVEPVLAARQRPQANEGWAPVERDAHVASR